MITNFADNGILSFGNTMNVAVKIKFDNTNLVIGGTDTFSDDDFIFARVINSNTLKIENLSNNKIINFFPNPVKDKLIINYNEINDEITEIKLLDINGKVILSLDKYIHSNYQEIDLSSVSKGQYNLALKTKNSKIYNIRILKD